MKNLFIITFVASFIFFVPACDYMDETPYDWAQPKDVFSMENQYMKPVHQTYSYINSGFNRVDDAFLDAATDDGMCTKTNSTIHKISQGFTSSSSPVENCWGSSYKGIRQAIFTEKYLKEIPLFLNGQTPEQVEAIKQGLYGELWALRALFEFNLLKHYGGYAIEDQLYELGDPAIQNMQRSSFADCVEHIVNLCDSAAKYLDVEPASGSFGRMPKGAALAIKAKTLIFAASPLYNQPENVNPLLGYVGSSPADVEQRWKNAAMACAEVISLKKANGKEKYTLYTNSFDKLFTTCPNDEYIVFCGAAASNGLENRQFPPTLSRISGGGTVPTQEFVNAFTNADGTDFTGNTLSPDQYQNRDPRLNLSIIYNGATFGTRGKIYTKLGEGSDKNGLNVSINYSTNTGYYLRKFLEPTIDFSKTPYGNAYHLFPIIRLSDIYLCYAEAVNEAFGPDVDPAYGLGLTARAAVLKVRKDRAKFTTDKYLDNVTTAIQMREKIKGERRIELSFEEHRYFDLRRWMDGEKLNVPVHGVRIETTGGVDNYSRIVVDERRKFEPKMYYHPIPLNEIKTTPSIQQNPGW